MLPNKCVVCESVELELVETLLKTDTAKVSTAVCCDCKAEQIVIEYKGC